MHKNFPTVAGMKTRFLCSFTDANAEELVLSGYIIAGGQRQPMTPRGNNELIAPATDAGDHLFELRASGAVVVWGHLMARPSAFPPQDEDETAISVAAELRDGVVMYLTITLHEGPPGQKGDNAPVDMDYSPNSYNPQAGTAVAQAVARITTENVSLSTPFGVEDSHYYVADIPAKYVTAGPLHSIVLQGPKQILDAYGLPAYLAIQQEQAPGTDDFRLVAVSTNAVKLEADKAHEWLFEDVELIGQRLRYCLFSSRDNTTWNESLNIRSRVSVTDQWQDGHIFQPATANRLPEIVIKMSILRDKFAPVSHIDDKVAHLFKLHTPR